jgi:hypothetical protein
VNPASLRYDVTFHMVTRKGPRAGDIQRAFVEDLRAVHLNEAIETLDEGPNATR